MDKGKGIAVEREEGETNDTLVSYARVRDDIDKYLNYFELKYKNRVDLHGRFEKLKLNLAIMLRLVQFSHPNFDSHKTYEVHIVSVHYRLLDYVKSRISSQRHSKSSATLTEEQSVELMDILLMNLNDLSGAKSVVSSMTQYETFQNVCGLIRDFHNLKGNGCIDPEIEERVIPQFQLQFQLMAEIVEHFCWVLLATQFNKVVRSFWSSAEKIHCPCPRVDATLAHTLEKIIPIGLEVMHICFSNFRASNVPRVEHFIKQLVRVSPDILIHLRYHMVNATSSSTPAATIIFTIEFLLVILTDMSKDLIHHEKLFDLLAQIGAIAKELSALVCTENKSSKEATNDVTICAILKNIELLKVDLKLVFLKPRKNWTSTSTRVMDHSS